MEDLELSVAELRRDLKLAKERVVHLERRLSDANGEILRLGFEAKHVLRLQQERDRAIIALQERDKELSRLAALKSSCEPPDRC